MKNKLPAIFFYGLCSAAVLTGCASSISTENKTVPQTEQQKPQQCISFQQSLKSQLNTWQKEKRNNDFQIQRLKEMLTDSALTKEDKFFIRERITVLCSVPEDNSGPWIWTRSPLESFDRGVQKKEMEAAALPNLRDPGFTASQKLITAEKYVWFLADESRFQEAEAFAKEMTAAKDYSNPWDEVRSWVLLAHVYRWQDRYDDAMNAIQQGMKIQPLYAVEQGYKIADSFGKTEDADNLWKQINNPYEELLFFHSRRGIDWDLTTVAVRDARLCKMANDFIRNPKNDISKRMDIAKRYCCDRNNPGALESLRILKKSVDFKTYPFSGVNFGALPVEIRRSFQLGDYEFAVQLCEIFKDLPIFTKTPALLNIYVVSLGAVGKSDDAVQKAKEFAELPGLSPEQILRLKVYADILSGHSENVDKRIDESGLSVKDKANVMLSAARQCLLWRKNNLADEFSKKYYKYFVPSVERSISVPYFDTPVSGIQNWREIYPKLEKQNCDLPFKGSLDFLVTDVGTGNREVNLDKNAKAVKPLEISACCDRTGVHVFLRAESSEQRDIERGFAKGIYYEMYFAPGYNQPYTCIGAESSKGVTFTFNTTYNNKNQTRLNTNDFRSSFRSEMSYTDNDYVLHLFFAWDAFYNKLPENGSDWRFEVLAFAPNGGYTWGGSRGIHSASQWGNLRFSLSEKQIAEIRKEILFRASRFYQDFKTEPNVTENIFTILRDPYVGDPDFYRECVIPLEQELASYAKIVQEKKSNLSDEEVNEIYGKAVPKMKGLQYEIDELRRKYLMKQLMQGKSLPKQK